MASLEFFTEIPYKNRVVAMRNAVHKSKADAGARN
jgi:hypothetical protein